MPNGYEIKGNADSMLYHPPDSPHYGRTKAEAWFREEKHAEAAGFTHWKRGRSTGEADKQALASVPAGRFGEGSADPLPDGSAPPGFTIKGNADSMLYHPPDSPHYGRTKAEAWFREEKHAEAAGFTHWKRGRSTGEADKQALASVPAGRFGEGSADPLPDGSAPLGFTIKGNADSMLYHPEDSPHYGRTIAEVWFRDEETARAAGFGHWKKKS